MQRLGWGGGPQISLMGADYFWVEEGMNFEI
jgi:hypothetical protein